MNNNEILQKIIEGWQLLNTDDDGANVPNAKIILKSAFEALTQVPTNCPNCGASEFDEGWDGDWIGFRTFECASCWHQQAYLQATQETSNGLIYLDEAPVFDIK